MISVAIDGPAGAGKSTLARAAAQQLGYIYVDTGALYRAIGYYAAKCSADTASSAEVVPLLARMNVELGFVQGEQRVFVNGGDVSDYIRTPEMSMIASQVSAMPPVRAFLFDLQRDIAKANNVVMDGRDIGTVVLPDAQVKIFLTASPEERAGRRWRELQEKGEPATFEEVLADVIQRDRNDCERAIAPLKQAVDAVLVDTTGIGKEQSVERLVAVIRGALASAGQK